MCYVNCRKINRQGNIVINCPTYEDAVELAGCLYKDILKDGYNVKIEELFPCMMQDNNSRPVSETRISAKEAETAEEWLFDNFRFMFIFDWDKTQCNDL